MIYEKNQLGPMSDLYAWAYQRSCEQYGVVRQSVGEIDAYRIQARALRKEVMGLLIRECLHELEAEKRIIKFADQHQVNNPDKFIGLGVTEKQFAAWCDSKP